MFISELCRMNNKLKFILLFCLILMGCSAPPSVQSVQDELNSGKSKDISRCKDIISSSPEDGSKVDSESNI